MADHARWNDVGNDLWCLTRVSTGSTLWNAFYDQMLRMDLGPGVTAVAYADDLAVIITSQRKMRNA